MHWEQHATISLYFGHAARLKFSIISLYIGIKLNVENFAIAMPTIKITTVLPL